MCAHSLGVYNISFINCFYNMRRLYFKSSTSKTCTLQNYLYTINSNTRLNICSTSKLLRGESTKTFYSPHIPLPYKI